MEAASQPLKVPSRDQICRLNRTMISKYGGIYTETDRNLSNPGSLDYVLDAIRHRVFGVDLYPSLAEKAAALAWTIIKSHVFHDGCKRTAMEAAKLLLGLNQQFLPLEVETSERLALGLAECSVSLEDTAEWVSSRARET